MQPLLKLKALQFHIATTITEKIRLHFTENTLHLHYKKAK